MRKIILLAEEGEKSLINEVRERLHLGAALDEYEILVTGVGALNILASLRDLPLDCELLNIGYAGSAGFAIGSLVSVTESRLNHPNVTYPEPTLPLLPLPAEWKADIPQAVCYSNTDFVLQSDYHDCVFDMELAYIAGLGFRKLRALKFVSDNLDLHAYHQLTNGVQ